MRYLDVKEGAINVSAEYIDLLSRIEAKYTSPRG